MRSAVLALFFVSGALGLVYEVVWTRMLGHVFGVTSLAVGTVLAAFMGGLALGAWGLGRLADRASRPLRVYAMLEVGVGLAAFGAQALLQRVGDLSTAVHELLGRSDTAFAGARFVLAFVIVLLPTLLMGATLPVLARFVLARREVVGAGLSTLYALNTAGAVLGALLAGFVLVGRLGLDGTVTLAACGNVLVGLLAWTLSVRGERGPAQASGEPSVEPVSNEPAATLAPGLQRLLLGGLLVSGMTSFAYEVLWTRSLVFVLGNSTHAVSVMLTVFLLGLALGGWTIRFVLDRVRNGVALFGWIEVALGVTAAAALPLLFAYAGPHALRTSLGAAAGRDLLVARFGVALAVMLVPALLVGATFPLVARLTLGDLRRTGLGVGRAAALNTLGNVLGALLPAFFLLAWFGVRRGILAVALVNVGLGCVLLVLSARRVRAVRWALPIVLVAAAAGLARLPLTAPFPSENQTDWHEVLFYEEGTSATTMVLRDAEKSELSICVDGVEIGGNTFTELKQLLLAHLPKLLVDDVSHELSIGLGSGMLAGESLRHGRVEVLDCVEIEPSVVRGAAYFSEFDHDVLDDPRLRLIVDDVTSHLRRTDARYDVVSADEKTAQEYASNGFSYSLDYYELLRSRLSPDGLVAQWVPTTLPPSLYRMVLHTFSEAFPHVLLFYVPPTLREGAVNTIVVGSERELSIGLDDVRRRHSADPQAFASLRAYGLDAPESLLACLYADKSALEAQLAHEPLNTFDHPRYAFHAPEAFAVPRALRLLGNHHFLADVRRDAVARLLARCTADVADPAPFEQRVMARAEVLAGFGARLEGTPDDGLPACERALALAPGDAGVRAAVGLQLWDVGLARVAAGDLRGGVALLERALDVHGANALSHVVLGALLSMLGEDARALAAARRAVELAPRLPAAQRMLADTLVQAGRAQEGALAWRALLELLPSDRAALEALGEG